MAGILEGIRIIEMGQFVAVPSAGAVLADWGAEVLKVESLTGEPQRGIMALADTRLNWRFEVHNRNKKSLAVNLKTAAGREVVYRLVRNWDVFISNFQAQALKRLRVDYATLARHNPAIIYALLTAYGTAGPEREARGFDMGAAWARTGMQHLLGESGAPPPQQRGGVMDRTAGFHMVAGILAALLHRERTGAGQEVEFSLYHSGVWTLAADLQVVLGGMRIAPRDRTAGPNPLINRYRTRDGRWLQLTMLQPDLCWPGFCRALGRPDLEHDPRFQDMTVRAQNSAELIRILDDIFATRDIQEWERLLAENDCIFSRVQTPEEVIQDPQALANGFFAELDHPLVGHTRVVTTPVKFNQNPAEVRGPSPEAGQHTEEVLLGLGYTWDDIAGLKDGGVIP